jgi:endonuclease/exonuclease/phosphatase family metal-dependent hydrolase
MNILTCNIRFPSPKDGDNCWDNRKGLAVRVIAAQSPDIICFQEVREAQFEYLVGEFPGYDTHAVIAPAGRDPGNCIFYWSDMFERISAGGFWLSRTPHVEGSKSWGSACVRMASWVRLVERTGGVEFRVVNTHLDHMCQRARANQADMLVENARAYPDDYPQILTGDMNCDSTSEAVRFLKAGGWFDTYGTVHGTEDPGHTRHDFLGPGCEAPIGKMDWIFARGRVEVTDAKVVDDSENGRFPSDHYFVSATVSLGT